MHFKQLMILRFPFIVRCYQLFNKRFFLRRKTPIDKIPKALFHILLRIHNTKFLTGVALSIDVPASLPLIRCDALRLRQILLNLMSNAVKFTPSGGAATVSAAVEQGFAIITVADTGIGMRAEDIAIALEPFRQVSGGSDALTRRFAGTGLGLPLA